MARVSDKDGFILHGWMVTELHLSGGDLFTFGLVYQFSQQSKAGQYTGGAEYLSSWTGWTYKTAREHLKKLVELGLIEEGKQGVCRVYRASSQLGKKYRKQSVNSTETFGNNYLNESVKTTETNRKKLPKHKDSNIDNKEDNKRDIGGTAFSFYDSLLSIGVSPATAQDWMSVRKNHRATNTQTAFTRIKNEIERSGRSAEECIRLSVEKDWRGFEAKWLESDELTNKETQLQSKFKFH